MKKRRLVVWLLLAVLLVFLIDLGRYFIRHEPSEIRNEPAPATLQNGKRLVSAFSGPPQALDFVSRLNDPTYDIIYFNDSNMGGGHSTPSIADILSSDCNKSVLCISGASHDLHLFNYYIKCIPLLRDKKRLVIVPINMRSFGPGWLLNEKFYYPETKRLLRDKQQRQKSLKGYLEWRTGSPKLDPAQLDAQFKTELEAYYKTKRNLLDELLNSPAPQGLSKEEVDRGKLYIHYYAGNVDADHPLLKELQPMVDVLKKQHCQILFYFTPLPMSDAERVAGKQFTQALRENISVVKHKLDKLGCMYVDLSEALGSEHFLELQYAVEHPLPSGHEITAHKLSAFIKEHNLL